MMADYARTVWRRARTRRAPNGPAGPDVRNVRGVPRYRRPGRSYRIDSTTNARRPRAPGRACPAAAGAHVEESERWLTRPRETAPDTFPRLLLQHAPGAAGPSGLPREGPRHLADLDLASGRRRSARARLRAGRAGLQARDAPRDHRRQPAAPVLVDGRGAGAGRRSGADVPGRGGRRIGVRAERRRDRLRGRRGPGAGRQAAGGDAAGADARAHLFRRPARPAQLRGRHQLRAPAGDRPRVRPRASGFLRRRRSRGAVRRRGGDALHVGHHRQAEGRLPDPWGVHRRGPRRRRVRPAHGRRQHPVLPADGLGRRPPVLATRRRWSPASPSTARSRATR